MAKRRRSLIRPGGWLLLLVLPWLCAPLQAASIAKQLQRLAWEREFEVSGLDRLQTGSAKAGSGSLVSQVKTLLSAYDHVIVHSSDEKIRRVIIIGPKNSAPPPAPVNANENVLATRRNGSHHLVNVSMNGRGAARLDMELMIDTGASLVVLPQSKIQPLGLLVEQMQQRQLQTAKGKVDAYIGQLDSMTLGSEQLKAVEVAFVADDLLGDNALLGMNVLGRYLFILDDERNELTLIPDAE
jgi:clan AA aspartic protease (TIGR02281 family)